jgi:hypothetical protein
MLVRARRIQQLRPDLPHERNTSLAWWLVLTSSCQQEAWGKLSILHHASILHWPLLPYSHYRLNQVLEVILHLGHGGIPKFSAPLASVRHDAHGISVGADHADAEGRAAVGTSCFPVIGSGLWLSTAKLKATNIVFIWIWCVLPRMVVLERIKRSGPGQAHVVIDGVVSRGQIG